MTDGKWFENPMRIGAIQWSQGENTFKVPDILNDGGFNVEQLLHILASEGNIAAVFNNERDGIKLKEYIKKSKELGTRIILYYNAHIVGRQDAENNPNWVQRHKDGEAISAYDTYFHTCVNSKWRDEFLKRVEEGLDYGLDGIFLDGPIFFNKGCFCSVCRSIFEERYNHSLTDATPNEMREFKTDGIARFIKDVRELIRSSGKDTILYANSHGLSPNVTGCDIDGIYPYVDFLGAEGGFIFYTDPNKVSIWKGSQNAKYLETKARGKPVVIFMAGNHCPWARQMHTPEESRLLFASAVANGANVWYGIHGHLDTLSTPGGKAAYEFSKFLKKNEEYYVKTSSCPDAAIFWSKNTIHTFFEDVEKTDFTEKEVRNADYEHGSYMSEFKGIYDIMVRNHTQFTIIDEHYIKYDDMSRFKVIVLPNAVCMDRDACTKIQDYIRAGGTIVSTMASSLCDDAGNKLEKPQLSDVFGIERVDGILSYKRGCSYLKIEDAGWFADGLSSEVTAGFSKTMKCSFKEGVKILASMYEPMDGVYDMFPTVTYPAVTVSQYGKGHGIFIGGGLGETLAKLGITDMKKMFGNIINRYANSSIKVENAYETVEVELRNQPLKSRYLIHFVNFTGFMQRPIDTVIPCRDIKVFLKLDKEVVSVSSVYNAGSLDFKVVEEGIEFIVPVIDEYELVAVQMEGSRVL